jgi:hypothetical protein
MGAAEALKFGYKWKIGNGRSVRFWEDIWFGILIWQHNFGTYTLFLTNKLKLLGNSGMAQI